MIKGPLLKNREGNPVVGVLRPGQRATRHEADLEHHTPRRIHIKINFQVRVGHGDDPGLLPLLDDHAAPGAPSGSTAIRSSILA